MEEVQKGFSFDLGSERTNPKKGREIQPLKKASKSIWSRFGPP